MQFRKDNSLFLVKMLNEYELWQRAYSPQYFEYAEQHKLSAQTVQVDFYTIKDDKNCLFYLTIYFATSISYIALGINFIYCNKVLQVMFRLLRAFKSVSGDGGEGKKKSA